MIGELNIYGVFVPPFLAVMIAALIVAAPVRLALRRLGLYRFVWHRPLFDLAVYIIILGGLVAMLFRGAII